MKKTLSLLLFLAPVVIVCVWLRVLVGVEIGTAPETVFTSLAATEISVSFVASYLLGYLVRRAQTHYFS